ncbi:type I DNA topoisomerase, partial [candidate division KSB1 bacterium]
FTPQYEISPDKNKIVKELKKIANEAEIIWLATDEDREGEAISWHLLEALGLDEKKTKRIVFHEITKTAISEAIEKPRSIDKNLVNAQQARRVLDRLVGFELSPLLWRKVKPALSAGRVQSVAVRLIVERENEIRKFKSVSSYRVTAEFCIGPDKCFISAELPKRFKLKEEAKAFLELCKDADFTISNIETKPAKKSPAPPFITSTLQQEASRKLGFSVSKTMLVAQQLYESGYITYMRTDSVNLSNMAIGTTKEEIIKNYGENYVKIRKYKTKAKGAQEAHEAIRPTYISNHKIDGDASQKRLYELIWKRTIASQMSDAELEKTTVTISISNSKENFQAIGEVLKFDGFLKVYIESTDEEEEEETKDVLPPLKKGQALQLNVADATERFTKYPNRYTEASLVKKMEELGIGRPSTYAPTISTIQKREYVVKEDRKGVVRVYEVIKLKDGKITEEEKNENFGFEKGKLFPTDIGSLVNEFLVQYFDNIMDYHFTASVEEEFDEIAKGQRVWNDMIAEFYSPFHKQIEDTLKISKKVSGEKLLGKDPETGKNVFVKLGRYGPLIQIGETDTEEKPKFAGLLKGQSMETITLEEALKLFDFPKTIGTYEDDDLVVGIGRYGPYIRHKGQFYALMNTDNPASIQPDRAIELIIEKRNKSTKKVIKEFKENESMKVLNGRYGPYIAVDKKNYRIPKGTDPEGLSLEDCMQIVEKAEAKKKK